MTKLEQAARALLAHWDTPAWRYLKPTGDLMADLREALAEQAKQEPVAEVVVRPLRGDQSQPTTDIKWLQRPTTGKLYAAPVRTKDLTDYEIEKAVENIIFDDNFDINIARTVIAADREKNK